MSEMAPITDADPTPEEMAQRVARFRRLVPTADYVDAGIPGCERTTYRVIGHRPDAPIAADGFHLNLVQCAPGKQAPLHNHLTEEVFLALGGTWEVFWGPEGRHALRLEPWDTISIPPGVSRGFRNVGEADAWLAGMAAGHDPGRINWPGPVRDAARAAGVELPEADPPPRRPKVDPGEVSLREVTADNVRAVVKLRVAPSQQGFVADNATSIAQAHFHADAWYRAIFVGDEPAGFVMISDHLQRPDPSGVPEHERDQLYLWRFMIDERHQGRGIGQAALEQVMAHGRTLGAYRWFVTSYVKGPGSPLPFYERLGFVATGEEDDGEWVLKRPL